MPWSPGCMFAMRPRRLPSISTTTPMLASGTSMLTCSIGCIDTSTRPPAVRVSCVGNCVARGCPQAQSLFDQAFNCFIQHINECGASIQCLTKQCDPEVAACIGANCPQPP